MQLLAVLAALPMRGATGMPGQPGAACLYGSGGWRGFFVLWLSIGEGRAVGESRKRECLLKRPVVPRIFPFLLGFFFFKELGNL